MSGTRTIEGVRRTPILCTTVLNMMFMFSKGALQGGTEGHGLKNSKSPGLDYFLLPAPPDSPANDTSDAHFDKWALYLHNVPRQRMKTP